MSKTKHPTQNAGIWLDKGAVARDLSAVRAASIFEPAEMTTARVISESDIIKNRADEHRLRVALGRGGVLTGWGRPPASSNSFPILRS